jgi:riboflavin synthase
MFTGIVQQTGVIKRWQPSAAGGRLTLAVKGWPRDIQSGESIAVNGCCLTVVIHSGDTLIFDVSDETIAKTALENYRPGMCVNLERALNQNNRFGGHFVLGHVDTVGRIKSIAKGAGSVMFTVKFPKEFSKLMIEKGSVTVDGISLTACRVKKSTFQAAVIPHTLKETNLSEREEGDAVNLEFDVLGKYVQRLVKG